METVRAFVGHSFDEEDAQLINTVLTYLDGIAELNSRFSWEHAEPPEPSPIDAKVLRLIDDKNLFIGICTRKERVFPRTELKRCLFSLKRSSVDDATLSWKTSDWIIQEIGLAIGRGMKVILLIEKDVRSPGGLQGTTEYIPLRREAPEKSFQKLLEMISSLCHDASSPQQSIKEEQTTTEQDSKSEPPDDRQWTTPTDTWSMGDYRFGLMHSIAIKDSDAEKVINEKFLTSELAKADDDRKAWSACQEYFRITFSNNGQLSRLEEIQAEAPNNYSVSNYLAKSYRYYEEHKKAASMFEHAAHVSPDTKKKISYLGSAAISYQKAGEPTKVSELTNQMRKLNHEHGLGEEVILSTEKELATEQKKDEAELAAQERLLELHPDDEETRFSLAYKYSQLNREALAAYHYTRIPPKNRSSAAWNNLGVSLESLGMPIKSTEAYREAEKLGGTLAMSNLANKFIAGGFVPEARKLLDSASKLKDHHQNVNKSIVAIDEAIEAEGKKETEAFSKVKPLSEYYRLFGLALAHPLNSSLDGKWHSQKCILELTTTNGSITAIGSYTITQSDKGLAGLINSSPFGLSKPTTPKIVINEIKYTGVIQGSTITGKVTEREKDATTPSTIFAGLLLDTGATVLMWISDTADEISVCQYQNGTDAKFYTLTRVKAN